MIQLITEPWYGEFSHTLFAIHQLRHRVFKVRMDWDVQISGDMEVDKFDSLHPAYLAQLSDDGRVQGCVRLLPTKGPTMLRDTFPALLNGQPMPMSPQIWESSRFAIDGIGDKPGAGHGTVALYGRSGRQDQGSIAEAAADREGRFANRDALPDMTRAVEDFEVA